MIKLGKRNSTMTCVVAAKYNGKTIIGADSCTQLGDRKLVKMRNASKLVRFEHFIVGQSGTGPTREILNEMLHEPICESSDEEETTDCYDWKSHKINSEVDASKFLEKFMELYEQKGDAEDMGTVELLIITKDSIFCTVGEITVFEVDEFWSVGSGGSYAMGALHVNYPNISSEQEFEALVRDSIDVACKYAPGCEPPIELVSFPRD